MRLLRLVPDDTRVRFMRWRRLAFAFTAALTLVSVGSILFRGLNLGLDFAGGILIEGRGAQPADLAVLRARIERLGLGEASIQTFGSKRDVMVRVREQPGGPAAQQAAIAKLKGLLEKDFEIRQTEFIGPQVSHELLRDGVIASLVAVALIAVYVWFRFEWQFGISALITTFHDVIATFGLFSVFQLEFNLTVVAALLTIAGYSINDTVVVFDRIRESLRRYRTMPLDDLIDASVNQTLSRTILTSGTTMLAVLSLLAFGGPVLRNFALALTFGILIGTYSSIFVASAMLLHMPSLRAGEATGGATKSE